MPRDPYIFDKAYVKDQKGPLENFSIPASTQLNEGEVRFEKGEMTGRFEMGSTIVMIWESAPDTRVHVTEGEKVRLGQDLVSVKN